MLLGGIIGINDTWIRYLGRANSFETFENGMYYTSSNTDATGKPEGAYIYGCLFVFGGNGIYTKIYFPHNKPIFYVKVKYGSDTHEDWVQFEGVFLK